MQRVAQELIDDEGKGMNIIFRRSVVLLLLTAVVVAVVFAIAFPQFQSSPQGSTAPIISEEIEQDADDRRMGMKGPVPFPITAWGARYPL